MAVKLKWVIQETSQTENLNTENYHDTKKLMVSKKNSLTSLISLHVIKMSQNPP